MKRAFLTLRIALAAAILLPLYILIAATQYQGVSYRLAHFSNGDSLPGAEPFRVSGPILRSTRGVLLQGMAGFAEFDEESQSWRGVGSDQVTLQRSARGYCMVIASAPCADFPQGAATIEALAKFVTNGKYRAFTLTSDARRSGYESEAERLSAEDGMTRVRDGVWASSYLAADPFLLQVLVGLDTQPVFTSEVRNTDLEDARRRLNESLRQASSDAARDGLYGSVGEDSSYLVSDIGANLVVFYRDSRLRCAGYPTRAHWRSDGNSHFADVHRLEVLGIPESVSQQLSPKDRQEVYLYVEELRWVICTAAVLRTLHSRGMNLP